MEFCRMQKSINPETKISQLLLADPEMVINTLISLNAKFSRLRNPLLRRLLVKRVSIADACKISNTPVADFMGSMKKIGFRLDGDPTVVQQAENSDFVEPRDYLEFDVRPVLAAGEDPLKAILATVKLLEADQGLKLINTFEPLPLIHLLADKGFAWRVSKEAPDVIVTYFNKVLGAVFRPVRSIVPAEDHEVFDRLLAGYNQTQLSYLDVRGLEMPGPMLAILAQTPDLKEGKALYVHHKKVPVYLLPELEKQGLCYAIKNVAPGDVHLLIYRK